MVIAAPPSDHPFQMGITRFIGKIGGARGIRTPETREGLVVFKTTYRIRKHSSKNDLDILSSHRLRL